MGEGVFQGRIHSPRGALEGTWFGADPGVSGPFQLVQVARYEQMKEIRADGVEASVAWPVFIASALPLQDISDFARLSAFSSLEEFIVDAEGVSTEFPEIPPWSMTYQCSLKYYSDRIISLLVENYAYTGGAHGNTGYRSLNFRVHPEDAELLGYKDLFLPGSPWLKALSDRCMADLREQEAQWVLDGTVTGFTEEDLRVFLITPRGLRIIFVPYQVGPYSNGPHDVLIPYESLANFIDPEGPLADFVGTGKENLKLR